MSKGGFGSMTGDIEPRQDLCPGQTTGAYVAVNYETHDFICKYGGLLVLTGLVCLARGEGIGPLIAGILATCTVAAFANRLSRGTRNR
jgi:hypothetical protein